MSRGPASDRKRSPVPGTLSLADQLPRDVLNLWQDQLFQRQADGVGRAGRAEDDLVPVDAGGGAGEHGGGADLLVGEEAEDLAKAGQGLLKRLADDVVGAVTAANAGAPVKDDDAGERRR